MSRFSLVARAGLADVQLTAAGAALAGAAAPSKRQHGRDADAGAAEYAGTRGSGLCGESWWFPIPVNDISAPPARWSSSDPHEIGMVVRALALLCEFHCAGTPHSPKTHRSIT